jgi:hypothetical protein
MLVAGGFLRMRKNHDTPEHVTVVSKTSYSVAPKGDGRADGGVFKTLPLPRGRKMKMLDRDVFEGAVRAAMRAKRTG